MTQEFAVILLDVRMPGMDGFETAALMRVRLQSEMTPIIFITAFSRDEIAPAARYVEGAVDFMFAPVQPDELRAKVSVFAKIFLKAEELARQGQVVQRSADQLRLLTDAAPIGIFQTDSANRYVYTNPRWTEITGIPADEALGRDWTTIVAERVRIGQIVEVLVDTIGAGELCNRFEIEMPKGPSRKVLVTSKSIPDIEGQEAGWVGTVADVTAEARAEVAMSDARDKADEASHLKSDFLANMSHEIRTPMNGVIGMVDLLLETDLDARQRDYARTIRSSGESLLTILNDILDFSKVEAGELEIEDIEFDLRATVSDVVDLLERSSQAKGLQLGTVIDPSVPTIVIGDSGRVRQVLINLVGNAIKFTQTGQIRVRVSGAGVAGEDTAIRFDVTDTGDGIPADKLTRIFKPFIQADTSTSRKYGGTGLGLAISGQLVALMGGDCGASSQLGKGSNFWFTIVVCPVADAKRGAGTPIEAVEKDPPLVSGAADASNVDPSPMLDDGASRHILLAEDNPVNQRVAIAMLENLGFQVQAVSDGAAAVAALASRMYDAILMDCQMPILDGYQATSKIRHLEGPASCTPIIALTAAAMKFDRARCISVGMDDYLTKPLRLDALSAALTRWVPTGSAPVLIGRSFTAPLLDDTEAGSHGGTDEPTLSPETLAELEGVCDGADGDLMGELVGLFLSEADARIDALQVALGDLDGEALARGAHALSGASSNLGAHKLARLCFTLERDSHDGDLTDVGELMDAVEVELGNVRAALCLLRPEGVVSSHPIGGN
jgi:PAS domain S-box-containing protein